MEKKELFNGFIANGLQFRLDGYTINESGVDYRIIVKNITSSTIRVNNLQSQFDTDWRWAEDEMGRRITNWGHWVKEFCYNSNYCYKNGRVYSIQPQEECIFQIRYKTDCATTEHTFSFVRLKIDNFMELEIHTLGKEDNYAWYISDKKVASSYDVYVPVTSVPNTEDEKLTFLVQTNAQLEKMLGIKIGHCNVHKNEDETCNVIFEISPDSEEFSHDFKVTACVYNKAELPVLLQSIEVNHFEAFNVYKVEGLKMLPVEDISKILVFPTKFTSVS